MLKTPSIVEKPIYSTKSVVMARHICIKNQLFNNMLTSEICLADSRIMYTNAVLKA